MPPSRPADHPLDRDLLRRWPLPSNDTDDKRGRGTVLIVGGSVETPGAVLLAGTAALRVGGGKLQVATAGAVAPAVAIALPEALVMDLGDDDAAAIAPLPEVRRPLVRRAGESPAASVVITPNREELTGLFDDADPDDATEAADLAGRVATTLDVSVASFGCVAAPDGRRWLDHTEVRGLGTSGAGDVLAGAAGGLAARCQDGPQAACWAAVLHRLAARRLATTRAPIGYLARELADELSSTLALLDPWGGAPTASAGR